MLASVYALTFLLRGAGIAAPEASALADAACARRTLFAVVLDDWSELSESALTTCFYRRREAGAAP